MYHPKINLSFFHFDNTTLTLFIFLDEKQYLMALTDEEKEKMKAFLKKNLKDNPLVKDIY